LGKNLAPKRISTTIPMITNSVVPRLLNTIFHPLSEGSRFIVNYTITPKLCREKRGIIDVSHRR
jgi:hypothetical protein